MGAPKQMLQLGINKWSIFEKHGPIKWQSIAKAPILCHCAWPHSNLKQVVQEWWLPVKGRFPENKGQHKWMNTMYDAPSNAGLGPILLTWVNFNPIMDKLSHAQ